MTLLRATKYYSPIGNRFWPSRALARSVKSNAYTQNAKVGPEVKHGLFRVAGRARNPPAGGLGAAEQGVERRTRALPDVSGQRHCAALRACVVPPQS